MGAFSRLKKVPLTGILAPLSQGLNRVSVTENALEASALKWSWGSTLRAGDRRLWVWCGWRQEHPGQAV